MDKKAASGIRAARLMEAMLESCGDLGYRRVSVKHVLERSGVSRGGFYAIFANKAECYAQAYETHSSRLCAELLAGCAEQEGWRAGLDEALARLGRFACERPLLAGGLLIQVHVAGKPALDTREELLERLSRALDGARRETRPRHSPPPLTAAFMVRAIEAAVASALTKGEPELFTDEAAPALAQLVAQAYG